MKCTEKERESCNEEKLGCKGCAYYDGIDMKEKTMIDTLQSFVDLATGSKYEDILKEDIEATKWALKKIEELRDEKDYYKARYLEFNNGIIEAFKK